LGLVLGFCLVYKYYYDQSINQSIKTHFYSAICRERIRGASFHRCLWDDQSAIWMTPSWFVQ